jgi:hypothetical protein
MVDFEMFLQTQFGSNSTVNMPIKSVVVNETNQYAPNQKFKFAPTFTSGDFIPSIVKNETGKNFFVCNLSTKG